MALAARADKQLAGRIVPELGDELTIVDEADLAVREVLADEYHFEGFVGQGGMSVVFLAREIALNRLVALKVLPRRFTQDATAVERFRQEATIAASLDHPNIVPIHRFGSTSRCLWYAMKYIRGRSLEELLRDTGPLDLHDCYSLVEQIAGALQHAHRRGVVHRDMKPANVMLDESGWAYVCDFGVAKATGNPRLTQTGGTLGTPLYMSPEQLYGQQLDGRSDQYSLAVLTFELLAGTHPFAAEAVGEIIRRQCAEPAPSLAQYRPELPVVVVEAVTRALSKRPEDRFPDVVEFLTAMGGRRPRRPLPTQRIESALATCTTAPLKHAQPPARWGRRLALVAVGLGAVAVAALVGLPLLRRDGGAVTQVPAAAVVQPPAVEEQAEPVLVPGRLFVSSDPWGRLFIDGVSAGRTPAIDVPIAAGLHRIRIERDGYVSYDEEVRVEAGVELRRTGIRLEARRQ